MNNKLTYKIQDIIKKNEYTEIIIKHKVDGKEVKIQNANIKFRYEPERDKGFLSFGKSKIETVCEVEDASINEVIVYNDALSIETDGKSYYCYQDLNRLYN